jgi:pilus assembly protein CpaE
MGQETHQENLHRSNFMDAENTIKSTDRGKSPISDSISLVTICLDPEFLDQLKHFLGSIPLVQVRSELRHYLADEGDSTFVDRLRDLRPDICVIDFDKDREKASRTAERIHEILGDTAIFAVSSLSQPDLIIRAMRCGCNEYLTKPLDRDELLEALARVGARKKEKREQSTGQVLVFLGAKGGCGATTLGIHLGVILAKLHSRRTLLVDLHPELGDASLFLALPRHQYHIYELAENTHRLDSELLQGFLIRHPSGLDVLPAPDGFDAPRHVSPDSITRTLEFLRLQYEYVIIDCRPGLNDQNMAVIDDAHQVYLITTPEVPSLKNIARYLDTLNRFHYPPDKIRVVVNRHSKGLSITDQQMEKAIRKNIFWKVPNQYGEVLKSINTGNPLALLPRSELMRNLGAWAESFAGSSAQGGKKGDKGGILGLFNR